MATIQWHKLYVSQIAAPPAILFQLLSDLPSHSRWLPSSDQYAETADVEPYPVQLGSRYHDGKPAEPGSDWWGTVTGFQPDGSIDFRHEIPVRQLRAIIDVHIHYSIERDGDFTTVSRWLVLDIRMPGAFRPLKPLITARFDKENVRTMAALKQHAEKAESHT